MVDLLLVWFDARESRRARLRPNHPTSLRRYGYFCPSRRPGVRPGGARRRRRWPPTATPARAWRRCCSGGGRRSSRSAPARPRWRWFVRPVATSRSTSSSRGRQTTASSDRGGVAASWSSRSTSGAAPSSTNTARAPSSSSCAVSSSPSARRARPTRHPRARTVVPRCRLSPALAGLAQRVERGARVALGEQHRPVRVRGIARSTGAPMSCATGRQLVGSGARGRRTSPVASMISTYADRTRARASDRSPPSTAPRIAAAAASARPCARRSSASPGCG